LKTFEMLGFLAKAEILKRLPHFGELYRFFTVSLPNSRKWMVKVLQPCRSRTLFCLLSCNNSIRWSFPDRVSYPVKWSSRNGCNPTQARQALFYRDIPASKSRQAKVTGITGFDELSRS
jgi:hypothetical protein